MKPSSSLRKSLDNIFFGGVATSIMDTLATGPVLIAYALLFGAGNITIGFLGSIGFVGNLMHLYSAWLIEQGKTPKWISVFFSAASRPFYLIAALLAFFVDSPTAPVLLVLCFTATYMIGSVAGGAWLPWMKALVPAQLMGRFFSHRFKWMMIAKMVFYGLSAAIIHYFETYDADNVIFAYSILLTGAFLIGIYGVYTLTQAENKPVHYQKSQSFFKKTAYTLKNKRFRGLLLFLGMLNFAVNFVTPFFTVFMLKSLDIPTPWVFILTLISQTTHAFSVKTWGKLADKKNCQIILHKSIPVFMLSILLFMICTYLPSTVHFANISLVLSVLIVTHVLLGIGQSAITLGMNNISLLHIPEADASIYLSVNSVFKSFTSAVASIIAGATLTGYEWVGTAISQALNLTMAGNTMGWNLFFLTGLVLCLVTFPLLKRVQKC
ncbi:MAG: hypothetical protein ACI4QM_01860 [Alphaproteobacteria bacterium]